MLSRAPFVSVVIFFATGILAGDALRLAGEIPVAFVFLGGAWCVWLYFLRRETGFAIGLVVWMLLLGMGCKIGVENQKDDQIAALNALKYTSYTAEVTTLAEKRTNSIRFEVNATRFRHGNQWIEQPSRALFYLPDSLLVIPKPGDRLVIRGRLEQPAPPQNPEQFDYTRYLRNKGILYTAFLRKGSYQIVPAFLRKGSYQIVPNPTHTNPAYWPETVSEWADNRFRENIGDSAAYGLVKAMLLGRRDDLRAQQVGDYVISGAVHILSVSGMHVAVIFLAISAAFGWLRRWRVGKWIYFIVMAGLLGFYALVTGLPPSVQRAVLMCMVLVTAEVAGRKQYSINTLAFSALIILLIDPCALYDVGFQLSYLAMAGIFLLYEPIYSIGAPSNRVFRFIWQVTVLALAAQLSTFPLSLFYFHQFPTYFWLVNPLVVTFTNILLPAALGLLLLSASGVPWLTWLVGQVVCYSARLTDWSASIPRSLPGYLVENLHLNAFEVVMLYGIVFLLCYTFYSRSIYFLRFSAVAILLFVSISITNSLHTYLTTEQISFQIPKHHVVSFKSGNVLYLVSDQAFVDDTRAFDFNVKNYVVNREIAMVKHITAP